VVEWVEATGSGVAAGAFAEVADWAELIVLATNGEITPGLLADIGPPLFAGKVVIDPTNPIDHSGERSRLSFGFTDSLSERIQRTIPDAHVVKAFNSVGSNLMVRPRMTAGIRPTMFIAGDDDAAKAAVAAICAAFGWDVSDQGGLIEARLLEPLCFIWVNEGISRGWDRPHAFAFLTPAE
jgi:predicted dinucleotide-binding enzyme